MKIISFINFKGGVAKTISAINFAFILAVVYGLRVLLVDNDKQANVTKFFDMHSYDAPSISNLLTDRDIDIHEVIQNTAYEGLDIIPANMILLRANKEVLLDSIRPQQTRLKKHFQSIANEYDYCIIDNAPDINMSIINALVATDDILVPVKPDKFAFDGLQELLDQIEDIKEYNPTLNFRGCFATIYQKNNAVVQGVEWIRSHEEYKLFNTIIRSTSKVIETTYTGVPLQAYSKNCNAAKDYVALVEEYLSA
jgi:chromosome partitioning protein